MYVCPISQCPISSNAEDSIKVSVPTVPLLYRISPVRFSQWRISNSLVLQRDKQSVSRHIVGPAGASDRKSDSKWYGSRTGRSSFLTHIGGNSYCNSCTEKGSFATTCRLPPCPSSSNHFKYSSASYLLKSLVEPHLPLDQIGFRPLGVSWLTRTIDGPVIWLTIQLTDQDNWLMFVCLLFIWHISPGTI